MELFNNETARERLITRIWARYHAFESKLKPEKLGEKMTDINPHVLDPDYFLLRNCIVAHWTGRFEGDPAKIGQIIEKWLPSAPSMKRLRKQETCSRNC